MHMPVPFLLLSLYTSVFARDVLIRERDPNPVIVERIVCNSDNVLRALKSKSALASPFCSSFLNIPGVTTFKSVAGVTATTSVLLSTTNSGCSSHLLHESLTH